MKKFLISVLKYIRKLIVHLINFIENNTMDTTALQEKIANLQQAVANDQTQLSSDQSALDEAQAELAQVSLINSLEALTVDEVATVNAALAGDSANTSGITLTLPSQPAQ